MALFHTSPYHLWMLYKTFQVGYCLRTATHKRLLWSEAVICFFWVSVHVSAWLTWLYSEESEKFSQKLVLKNVGYSWPATLYPRHATCAFSILTLFLASLSSLFIPRHQHLPDVAGQPGLIPTDTVSSSLVLGTERPTFLSPFVQWLSRSAVFTRLSEFVVHGCTGLLFERFI